MGSQVFTSFKTIDIRRIMQLLPHRYPFLLIDKVIDINGEISGTGIKNVSANEPFFENCHTANLIMPPVLLLEAMAQTVGVVVLESLDEAVSNRAVYFMSIDNCTFQKSVGPGDQLVISVRLLRKRLPVYKYHAEIRVRGEMVVEAEIGASGEM